MTSSVHSHSVTSEVLDFPEHLRTLFERIRSDESLHDVAFVVQNERFSTNRCVVAAASPVLKNMLTNGMKETKDREIQLEEVNVHAWRMVLDYVYTARVEVADIDSALQCLECANRFQFEDLEQVVSNYIEKKLHVSNWYRILVVVDRIKVISLRKMTMKFVRENFFRLCFSAELSLLAVDEILELLNDVELVVRSELDVFKAVLRLGVCSGVDDIGTELNAQIVTRAHGLLVQLNVLPHGSTLSEPESGNVQSHSGLFDCININNMSNMDLRLAVRLCRQLCAEAQANHNVDLVHLRKFGEKAFDKLLESSNPIPRVPTLPYDRVPHGRSNEIFTFSYTLSAVQYDSWGGDNTPEFEDKTGNASWRVKVYFRGCNHETRNKYVSVFLYRNSEGREEEMEFGTELFIEIERGHNESGSLVISRNNPKDNANNYSGGERCGYHEFMPISYLEGKRTVIIGAAIYMKSK